MKKLIHYLRKREDRKFKLRVREMHLKYGTVIAKKFVRSRLNPMRYILGKNGAFVVDTKKFYEMEQS